MWSMYDQLIAGIPDDLMVDDYVQGGHFSFLRAGDRCGLAHDSREIGRPSLRKPGQNLTLREAASLSKSWNMEDATLGMAAINAWYNTKKNLASYGIILPDREDMTLKERKEKNPLYNRDTLHGKKVAMIGHFRNVEKKLQDIADLYILERSPKEGDYPDSACEYLLPEMDYIYVTGMTLVNKTLKRLLELKKDGAVFTLMGPTTTLSPVMFSYGVDRLASFVVTDPVHVRDVVARDATGMFAGGVMVDYGPEDFGR